MQHTLLFKKFFFNSLFISLVTTLSCSQNPGENIQQVSAPVAAITSLDSTTPPPLDKTTSGIAKNTSSNSELNSEGITSKKSGYDLSKPDHVCNLPKELLEISALSYDVQNSKLIAVNDEKANIYLLDINNCEVSEKHDFGKKGDYEGIETIGSTTYVVKSNGDIFTINQNTGINTKTYKTPLSTNNDVEGLGYDEIRNELILACKGAPNIDKKPKLKRSKAFYAFDLNTNKLTKKPKFVIKDKKLDAFFKKMSQKGLSKKGKKKLKKRLESFSPSGIAKHPISGHYYLLSSVGRLLILCNDQGDIQQIHFLKEKMFSQPEGICFTPDGTMYISNEGRSLVAKILVFNYEG